MKKSILKNIVIGALSSLFLNTQQVSAETVDWLVLYDNDSYRYYNGDPSTAMQSWVSRINAMYSRSRVDIQLRLVGVLPLEPKGSNQSEVLSNVRSNTEAKRLRDARGADFVTQLYQKGNCGVGYVSVHKAYAWNVVKPSCGAASTAAHELGHNMGLHHSRRQGNTGGTNFRYGLGYGVDNKFATLMAYGQSFNAGRVEQFSNPNLKCKGLPCGVPAGQSEEAYAALALQNVRTNIAKFRPTRFNGNEHTVEVDLNKTQYNYDFGTATSPVQNGWTRISPETNGDINWSGRINSVDRGKINGVNTINRDLVYSKERRVLKHKISNGTWQATMNMGDANHAHDKMVVKAEGVTKHANVNNNVGQFAYANFEVRVSDGELAIEFSDIGGNDPNWVLTRLSLKKLNNKTDKLVTMTRRSALGFSIDGRAGGANNQNIYLWTKNSENKNQQWLEIDRGQGYFSYKKNGTNFCIDGGNGGKQAQNVHLWECRDNNQNQHWKKVSRGSNYYSLIKRNAPGFSIDGNGHTPNNSNKGQNVILWPVRDHHHQHWLFKEIK